MQDVTYGSDADVLQVLKQIGLPSHIDEDATFDASAYTFQCRAAALLINTSA
jgi:hypothetical protein